MPKIAVRPFLKWPGGKRWLADRVALQVRSHLKGRYYEPFLGGGAVFFAVRPQRATLSDVNADLLNTYEMVRTDPGALVEAVKAIPVSAEDYRRVRESEPVEPLQRAARFLYLNRTAFGGMYRLNRNGKFNVPFGGGERQPDMLWRCNLIQPAASALIDTVLRVSDFEPIMEEAVRGDVVYCDPTYTVAHDNNGFVRYNEYNFAWQDQERLADAVARAVRRGVYVIVSNAYHQSVLALYRFARIEVLARSSTISRKPEGRREARECLILAEPS